MADISKCSNEECVVNTLCHRFTAIPSEFGQAYGEFSIDAVGDGLVEGSCSYYWPNEKGIKKSLNVKEDLQEDDDD